MFLLPRSDRPNMASQKSLGEDSGHHWIPGIEVARDGSSRTPRQQENAG
jgi:hypothetical protein